MIKCHSLAHVLRPGYGDLLRDGRTGRGVEPRLWELSQDVVCAENRIGGQVLLFDFFLSRCTILLAVE